MLEKETNYTPGPWVYAYGAVWPNLETAETEGGVAIAQRGRQRMPFADPFAPWEKDANMRLCAAAPELLDALERLEAAAESRDITMGDVATLIAVKAELAAAAKQARAVIAKATNR